MSETKNYGLHLTDDNTESFLDWRNKMNGTGDSNMQKLDRILHDKADKAIDVSSVLLKDAWEGTEAPFFQELIIEELAAEGNGSISLAHHTTLEQRNAARCAMLSVVEQSDKKLIIVADGELPMEDIPVLIILRG